MSDEVTVYLFDSAWFWWELMSVLHSAYPALNSWPSPVNCTTHSPLLLSWWQLHPSRYPGQTLSVLHGSFPLTAASKLSGNPLGYTFQIPPELAWTTAPPRKSIHHSRWQQGPPPGVPAPPLTFLQPILSRAARMILIYLLIRYKIIQLIYLQCLKCWNGFPFC